ncbi:MULTISPECIES: hypothetical protein [Sphingobium]|uniref:Methylthioribulose-1-phosphate dehydratase n=1 Tax=Sphingobium fuliginis (strain ATCC 27551) TaxID=336203 RepID=A0A292ZMI3_SPHSA|nr:MULTISPECIES: hypothetical protein [Sphingobium]GAY24093.1 methylthioribulose-1-phosphate dehydratase [Sphingobium fuliginis]
MPATVSDLPDPADALAKVGRRLDARGLAPATASNYSARLADGTILCRDVAAPADPAQPASAPLRSAPPKTAASSSTYLLNKENPSKS